MKIVDRRGFGVGGGAAAVAFARDGHDVTLFEQATSPGPVGAGSSRCSRRAGGPRHMPDKPTSAGPSPRSSIRGHGWLGPTHDLAPPAMGAVPPIRAVMEFVLAGRG